MRVLRVTVLHHPVLKKMGFLVQVRNYLIYLLCSFLLLGSQLFILFSMNGELHTVSLETEYRYDLLIPIYHDDDDDDDSAKSNIIATDWDNNTVYYADSSLGTINSLSLSVR